MNLYPVIEREKFDMSSKARGGYIDENGNVKIEFKYSDVGYFNDGIAKVKKDEMFYYINEKEEIIYEAEFMDYLDKFDNGIGIITNNGVTTFIDRHGKKIFEMELSSIREHFNEDGIATVAKNHKYGLLNKEGEFVVEPIYDFIGYYGEGLYPFRKDEKHGYINIKGEIISELNCKFCGTFNSDRANVITNDDKNVFINKKLEVVIDKDYDYYSNFKEGLAVIGKNIKDGECRYGCIDIYGNEVVKPILFYCYDFSDGMAIVETKEKYAYIDKNGRRIFKVPFAGYWSLQNFKDGLGQVRYKGNYGYINKKGELIYKPKGLSEEE